MEAALADWDPANNPAAAGSDPYKTVFVGRLSYDVTESKLKREFESYGPIKSIKLVEDKQTVGAAAVQAWRTL